MTRIFILTCLLASGIIRPASAQNVVHRAFLIADSGGFDPGKEEPVLQHLRATLLQAEPSASVLFLGDNIYQTGLPDSSSPGFALANARLRQQLDAVKGTGARVVVVPGNHDWDDSGPDGLAAVRRQERYVEAYLDQGNTFLPDDGLPGPETVTLAEGIELVVIDTEWWLRDQEKGFGDAGRYETHEEGDFLANLADVLRRKDDARLLVVGHHPMFSNGPHAGYLPLKEHLFPLTALWDNAYIPLPLIGSLYPLARAWGVGSRQDLGHWRYTSLREALTSLFSEFDGTMIYASGHDHSLQHFEAGNVDYLVAGSSSRPGYVAPGRGSAFTSSVPGFLEVVYYDDESVRLVVHTPGGIVHEAELQPARSTDTDLPPGRNDLGVTVDDSLYTGAAAPDLVAGPVKTFFLGAAHRRAWTTPVTVPVFDVGRVEGGLKPVQRGGGQQTVSIRLEAPDGRQFVLRSLTKDPSVTLPEALRQTVARDIVLDQVAILHPYGAVLVPPIARAAGIYSAQPRLYFVPKDPRLAPYEDVVGDRIMMFEERPDEDMTHAPWFGGADNVIGSAKMYSEITGDNDHRVDQRFFARSRLVDMLISDWDRHPDQWRWATIEPADGQGKIYRPIPRDRDWAFNRMDGLFPNIVQSEFVLPKFQEFKPGFGFIPGLNFNGMPQDRRLTAALTSADWTELADSVAEAITPEVAEEAISQWPQAIQEIQGEEFRTILLARAEGLAEAASIYSEYLDVYLDVVMSDKHEEFVVQGVGPGRTEVTVYKTTKEGLRRQVLYRRTIDSARTREVRLYGMGGRDRFVVESVDPGIKVFIVGGTGQDSFRGSPRLGRDVTVLDTPDGMDVSSAGRARIRLDPDPRVNRYDPTDYRFNVVLPSILLGYNQDDGIYLGGGASFHRHAFRKLPFAARHRLRANSAAEFGAFNFLYDGQFTEVLGAWDVTLDLAIRSPNSIRSFFGLGNETENAVGNRRFYQARLSEYGLRAGLRRYLSRRSYVQAGPLLEAVEVKADQDRFVTQAGVSPSSLDAQLAAGGFVTYVLDARDSPVLPGRGFLWRADASFQAGLNASTQTFGQLRTEAAFYLTGAPGARHVLATRIGLEHVTGDFPFFSAATLGGIDNLRGWRSTRFSGRTAAFSNLELRTRVGRFAGYLAQGQLGILAFMDHGRVWTDGEHSTTWHRGVGGGVWASVFDAVVLTATMGISREERHVVVSTGFLF